MANASVASERVSIAYGVWSVVVAVASPLALSGLVRLWLTLATTGPDDPHWGAVVTVSNRVGLAMGWALAALAIVLGVISIRGALPRAGQRGRTGAIALGWVGISIAAVLSYFYFLGLGT